MAHEQIVQKAFSEVWGENAALVSLIATPETQDSSQFPRLILKSFRKFWEATGRRTDESPRDDTIVTAPSVYAPFLVLRSSYRGLNPAGLVARKLQLEGYKAAHDNHSEAAYASEAAAKQAKLDLEQHAKIIRDYGGVSGVETYAMTIASDYQTAVASAVGKLSIARTTLAVSRTFHLPPEKQTYSLPNKNGSYEAFPFKGTEEPIQLWISGKTYGMHTNDLKNPQPFVWLPKLTR